MATATTATSPCRASIFPEALLELEPDTTVAAAAPQRLVVRIGREARTTAYAHVRPLESTDLRLVALGKPVPLEGWCRRHEIGNAIVGGFFVRPDGAPLGELWRDGRRLESIPFESPWHATRSCVHSHAGKVRFAGRAELPARPPGDLLQVGPLLVRDGAPVVQDGQDAEGFSAGRAQFDSDITVGRYPRAALGLGDGMLIAVACDGRGARDAGLTLGELALLMARLGAREAINLDGGGSTSLVCEGRLVNRPREEHGQELPGGRPVSTALLLLPRG